MSDAPLMYDIALHQQTAGKKILGFAFVLGMHLALIALAAMTVFRPQVAEMLAQLDVRLIEEKPPAKVEPEKPKPIPFHPSVHIHQPQVEQPVMTAAAEAHTASPATFNVAPQPAPPVASQPRFDADYLNNPAPPYPSLSHRIGEQGQVLLKVLVSSEGAAREVEIERGSGYARLDSAALEAVRRWRFVPAHLGKEAVEAWVLVPIKFRLN